MRMFAQLFTTGALREAFTVVVTLLQAAQRRPLSQAQAARSHGGARAACAVVREPNRRLALCGERDRRRNP
jgi:hypothetical protein